MHQQYVLVFQQEIINRPSINFIIKSKIPQDGLSGNNITEFDACQLFLLTFTCDHSCNYVGRTYRLVEARMFEHVPTWLQSNQVDTARIAISKHVLHTAHFVVILQAFEVVHQWNLQCLLNIDEVIPNRSLLPNLLCQFQFAVSLNLSRLFVFGSTFEIGGFIYIFRYIITLIFN